MHRALILAVAAGWVGCTGNVSSDTDSGVVDATDASVAQVLDAAVALDAGTQSTSVDAGAPFDAGVRPPYPFDGGPIVITDFIADMEPNSWREIPGTKMSTVSPNVNHYPFGAVVTAWGGGAFDSVRDRLIIFGGGHADSFVNNVFAFDLGTAKWGRMSEMPAAIDTQDNPPAVYFDKRL